MMTNAAATLDPVAAAQTIARTARTNAERSDRTEGIAAIAALASGIMLSLTVIAVMVTSPATIPMWCAAHGGCP